MGHQIVLKTMEAPGFFKMPFDTTILINNVRKLKEAFESGRFGDALIGAVNTGNGLMQQRIFTQNKDVQGNSFGEYVGKKTNPKEATTKRLLSKATQTNKKRIKAAAIIELTAYQRKRANAGRQISKKDLEFTGGLRRAIETKLENEKSAVIEFSIDEAAKIARGQENQITNIRNGQSGKTKGDGIKIFTLNDSERDETREQGLELIKEILK